MPYGQLLHHNITIKVTLPCMTIPSVKVRSCLYFAGVIAVTPITRTKIRCLHNLENMVTQADRQADLITK